MRAGSAPDARIVPQRHRAIAGLRADSAWRDTAGFCSLWQDARGRITFAVPAGGASMDERTRTELEAAVFRRLVEHLRKRTDVQNIDLMNLAGFCRNCLSNWMKEAADANGVPMSKEESREIVYGMPYDEWRAKYQKEASAEQKAAFEKAKPQH